MATDELVVHTRLLDGEIRVSWILLLFLVDNEI